MMVIFFIVLYLLLFPLTFVACLPLVITGSSIIKTNSRKKRYVFMYRIYRTKVTKYVNIYKTQSNLKLWKISFINSGNILYKIDMCCF